MRQEDRNRRRVCPKTGRRIDPGRKHWWLPWVFPVIGLVSLIWFLIRVVPKPSRATYPCQRLVAPIASGFVIWASGIVGSTLAWRKARGLAGQARYVLAGVFLAVAVSAIWGAMSLTGGLSVQAAFVPSDPPNAPIGVGKGIHPGRVVWVHDPLATHWDGSTGAWWEDGNVDQGVVDTMVSQSLRTLTAEPNDAAAWDALFRHFNLTRDLGDLGYQRGEKVVIKVNMNQDSGGNWGSDDGMPSPQMIRSVVEQLIEVARVPGSAITIYDASRVVGDPILDKVRSHPNPEFQDVRFVCKSSSKGRVRPSHDPAHPVRFANSSIPGNATAYLPTCVTEAKYLINMALLRAHSLFGVTLCAKNHFGSTYFPSNGGWTPAPLHDFGRRNLPMGSYNCLVDLIGHEHIGGKTLLYLIDGLYAARNQSNEVIRFESFGDDWASSLFLSQDPIAIDSVLLDFIRNEPRATDCTGRGVDNYLHEAALADDPPSGFLYDPEGDGTLLTSLGVHEHWNNASEKKYSRNLGTGEGIELVTPSFVTEDGPVHNLARGTRYDYIRHAVQDANDGDVIVVAEGTYTETVDFSGKAVTVRSSDPNDPNVVMATRIDGGTRCVAFSGGEDANSVLAGFTVTAATDGIHCNGASPTIRNCRIVDNAEAGVKIRESGNPALINCIIAGNGGPGIDLSRESGRRRASSNAALVLHCTIVGNAGPGIVEGEPVVANSIVRSNSVDPTIPQIDTVVATVMYCNVEGGFAGEGNMDADPLFVLPSYWADPDDANVPAEPFDTTALWTQGDYHLRPESPCIDAGSLDFTDDLAPFDIDGDPRPLGKGPDIGADEFVPPLPPPSGG